MKQLFDASTACFSLRDLNSNKLESLHLAVLAVPFHPSQTLQLSPHFLAKFEQYSHYHLVPHHILHFQELYYILSISHFHT